MNSRRSAELVADMRAGAVKTLLILGGNPVYDAPADLNFLDALKKVKLRAHVGLYHNETAAWCHWHVPEAHYLESWSDARAYDGTVSIVQPLIAPIYGGKTTHDVLNVLNNQADRSAHDTVQRLLADAAQGRGFRRFLADLPSQRRGGRHGVPGKNVRRHPKCRILQPLAATGLEIVFRPDPSVGDGAIRTTRGFRKCPSRRTR